MGAHTSPLLQIKDIFLDKLAFVPRRHTNDLLLVPSEPGQIDQIPAGDFTISPMVPIELMYGYLHNIEPDRIVESPVNQIFPDTCKQNELEVLGERVQELTGEREESDSVVFLVHQSVIDRDHESVFEVVVAWQEGGWGE
jgi:hypothetical protein